MKKIIFLILMFFVLIGTVTADWWDSSWGKCKDITISNSGGTLTDFPVYVNVTYDSDMQEDYDDLRFVDASCDDGGSQLNYEIENYTITEATVWVKTTLATGDNVISVYYGNAGASSGANPTGVWDDNYVMVQHMNDNSTTSIEDSTQYGNDGTKKGVNEPIEADGKIDKAQDFDGDNDFIDVADNESMEPTDAMTIGAWIKIDTWRFASVIVNKIGSPEVGYTFEMAGGTPYDKVCIWFYTSSWYGVCGNTSLSVDTWYHVVTTYNGSKVRIYVDGVLDGIASASGSIEYTAGNLAIGKHVQRGNRFFYGTIDEVRISNTTRSADWINQSYQIVQNQGTYVVFGSEEEIPPPIIKTKIKTKFLMFGIGRIMLYRNGLLRIR